MIEQTIDHFLRMTIQNNNRESRRREEQLLRYRAELSTARRNRRRQRVRAAWDALR
jgi:hypothetical protein